MDALPRPVAYLTTTTLAERWSCDPSTIRRIALSGQIERFKLGTEWRFSMAAVEAYEQAHTLPIDGADAALDMIAQDAPTPATYSRRAADDDYEAVFKGPVEWRAEVIS